MPTLRGTGPASAEEFRLSPAAAEVLKLVRAKLGEEVILAYVQNSDISFDLTAEDVIYLEKQGVPSSVLIAMLNKQADAPPTTAYPAGTDTNAAPIVPGSSIYETTPTYYAFDGSTPYWYNTYNTYPYWYNYHYWYDPWPYRSTFAYWWYPFYSTTFYWGHHHGHHHHHDKHHGDYHHNYNRQGAFPYDPNHRHNTALIQRNYRQGSTTTPQSAPATTTRSGSLFSNQRTRSWAQTTPGTTIQQRSTENAVATGSRNLFQANRSPALGTGSRLTTQTVPRDTAITGARAPSLFGGSRVSAPRAPSATFSAPRASTSMSAPRAPSVMTRPSAPSAMSAPRAAPTPSGGFRGGGVSHAAPSGPRGGGGGSLFSSGRR